MKTTVRVFQREFPRMRRVAAAGKTVVIEAGGQTFEFRARRKGIGVLGCMAGRARLDKLRDGPAIPPRRVGSVTPRSVLRSVALNWVHKKISRWGGVPVFW